MIRKVPEAKKMRAVFFRNHGGLENLEYGYLDVPEIGTREVLVEVKACALNHLDLWTLGGIPGVKVSMPHILGADIAGVVVKAGRKVTGIPLGTSVVVAPGISCGKCQHCLSHWDSLCPSYKILGFQVNGGFAEYVKVPEANIIPVTSRLSFEQWASIPLTFLTAWHMLVTRAEIKKKETVLIHAAGSGVGSAAIQIAKLFGAYVITTVGSDDKIRPAKALGADNVINYQKKDFVGEIRKITGGRGADIALDHIGPASFSKSLASLAKKGRLVTCGATTGSMVSMDLRFLFTRQLSVIGCYMGGIYELKRIIRRVKRKKLSPVIDKVFPLREAKAALERMQSRAHFGKIILTP